MPYIIVCSDAPDGQRVYVERVTPEDFAGSCFRDQLAQRLGWAVDDAVEALPPQEAPPPRTEQRAAHAIITA